MAVVMSTRMAAAAYLFFLLVSLANTAAIDRSSSSLTSSTSSSEQEGTGDSNNLYSGEIDDGSNYRRALVILKRVLSRAAKSPDPTAELIMTPFKKRTCYFNAGMSHSCDYKELLKSVDDANYWSSDFTPGRRRKRQFASSRGASAAPTILPF